MPTIAAFPLKVIATPPVDSSVPHYCRAVWAAGVVCVKWGAAATRANQEVTVLQTIQSLQDETAPMYWTRELARPVYVAGVNRSSRVFSSSGRSRDRMNACS